MIVGDAQRIAPCACDEDLLRDACVAQQLAHAEDVRLETARRTCRRLLTPEVVDEPVERDEPVRIQQ